MLAALFVLVTGRQANFAETWNELNAKDRYPTSGLWSAFGQELTNELNSSGQVLNERAIKALTSKFSKRIDPKEGDVTLDAFDPIKGMPHACFVTLHSVDYGGETGSYVTGFGRLLVWKDHDRFAFTVVGPINDDWTLEGQALRVGDRIVTAGFLVSGGNWYTMGAEVFEKAGVGWERTSVSFTDDEAGRRWSERIKVRGDIATVKMTVRLYPKWLDSSHAGPHVLESSTWTLTNGRWTQGEWSKIETVVSVVDDMLGAAAEGRSADISARCMSQELADEFERLYTPTDRGVHVQINPDSPDGMDDMQLTLWPHNATLRFRRVEGHLRLTSIEKP